MSAPGAVGDREGRAGPGLWVAFSAGIVLWMMHISGMAAMTPWICHTGATGWYHVLSVATAVPTALAIWPVYRAWRAPGAAGSRAFIGAIGVGLNAISLAAILAEWVPVFLLDPCAA